METRKILYKEGLGLSKSHIGTNVAGAGCMMMPEMAISFEISSLRQIQFEMVINRVY